jgi:hypothetical protein
VSKKARDRRVEYRRDERYLRGEAKPEDDSLHAFRDWNRARVRSLDKFGRHPDELLMTLDGYYEWIVFGDNKLLFKGGKPR